MKKGLIVMALVCGAVVLIAACGGSKKEDCKNCIITIENRTNGVVAKSKTYQDGKYCDAALKGVEGQNGKPEADGDATTNEGENKGGRYKVVCN